MTAPYDAELLADIADRALMGEPDLPMTPNDEMAPNPPESDTVDRAALQKALYGADFPGADPQSAEDMQAWSSWVQGQWESRREAVAMHLHLVERNRLFRAGQQWISANGLGPWPTTSQKRRRSSSTLASPQTRFRSMPLASSRSLATNPDWRDE